MPWVDGTTIATVRILLHNSLVIEVSTEAWLVPQRARGWYWLVTREMGRIDCTTMGAVSVFTIEALMIDDSLTQGRP